MWLYLLNYTFYLHEEDRDEKKKMIENRDEEDLYEEDVDEKDHDNWCEGTIKCYYVIEKIWKLRNLRKLGNRENEEN